MSKDRDGFVLDIFQPADVKDEVGTGTPLTQEGFTKFYINNLKNIGVTDRAIISQFSTTFVYEPIDRLSDEIERLTITNEALTEPVKYMKNRLTTKKNVRGALNKKLQEQFHYYMKDHQLSAKRAKALALIDTDAMYQTQQLVSELKYPSDLAVMAESRLAHKTRSGDGIVNHTIDA